MLYHEKKKYDLRSAKPLTSDELRDIKDKVERGSLVIIRRPPWPCICGAKARNFRYIGDIDDVAEWEVTCDSCGEKLYS